MGSCIERDGKILDYMLITVLFSKSQRNSEVVSRRCSAKMVFLKISQNSQENKGTLAQVFSCEFCEIFKNTFFDRTPLVAASGNFQPQLCSVIDKRPHRLSAIIINFCLVFTCIVPMDYNLLNKCLYCNI